MSNAAPNLSAPAALGWRLLAIVYDLLPVLALCFATAALVLLLRGGTPVAAGSPAAWGEFALMLLVCFAYFGFSWRRGGQTLGMRAWRLQLVSIAGGVPGWRQLALRFAVAGLSLGCVGIGFLWALLDRERRTWHDLASGTVVHRRARAAHRRAQRIDGRRK
jgi:uncharacterized RDD family membrane protein YckC